MALSYIAGERDTAKAADQPFESGIAPAGFACLRLSAKFHLIAMLFVIVAVQALFLFAWAIAACEAGWAGCMEALIFIGILPLRWRTCGG